MGFKLIKGTYHVKRYSPDGDSIKLMAYDRTDWDLLAGPSQLDINSRDHVQLRLEAIDSLETHYQTAGGTVYQPHGAAHAATDFILDLVGIDGVVWNNNHTRIVDANDGTPGFVLSREKEENGRPVSFAFAGTDYPAVNAAGEVFLTKALLRGSLNYKSIRAGHAYPTYYRGLFADLRDELTAAAALAREERAGVFADDVTNTEFEVDELQDITDRHVILPKLFRRLAQFIAGDPTPDLSHFLEWLEGQDEEVFNLREQNFTHFDDLIKVNGNKVKLTELPEHLVFGA